jgi:hypothetical protein
MGILAFTVKPTQDFQRQAIAHAGRTTKKLPCRAWKFAVATLKDL